MDAIQLFSASVRLVTSVRWSWAHHKGSHGRYPVVRSTALPCGFHVLCRSPGARCNPKRPNGVVAARWSTTLGALRPSVTRSRYGAEDGNGLC